MRILMAEDEQQLSRAVVAVLKHMGYEVDVAANGKEAVQLSGKNTYDCMVFDIMMPVMDGIEALRTIRASGDVTPVIMLTAKSEVSDRVNGLDAGADDYLTKPFAIAELAARIRSLIRRNDSYTPKVVSYGNVSLDTSELELKAENAVRLSEKEMQLMELLILNSGKQLTAQQLYEKVWKEDAGESKDSHEDVVWMYISYLKSKLEAVSADVSILGSKEGPFCLMEGRQGAWKKD